MIEAKSQMNEFFAALPALLKRMPDNPEIREAVVFAAWKRSAGRSLSEHTAPLAIQEQKLIIAVRDRTWKRQLESLAGELVYKINALLGQPTVTFIEFIIDPEAINERVGKPAETDDAELTPEAAAEIGTAAADIKDPALREQFLHAAAETLARNKRYGR